MISDKRHNEMLDGNFVYIIEMPEAGKCHDHSHRELDREMFNVKFWNGIGRTTSRRKAQRFDEWYNYIIHIHKKDIPWENAKLGSAPTDFVEPEPHFEIDTTEGDDNEE